MNKTQKLVRNLRFCLFFTVIKAFLAGTILTVIATYRLLEVPLGIIIPCFFLFLYLIYSVSKGAKRSLIACDFVWGEKDMLSGIEIEAFWRCAVICLVSIAVLTGPNIISNRSKAQEVIDLLIESGARAMSCEETTSEWVEFKISVSKELTHFGQISKEVKGAKGEAVGINLIAKEDLDIFIEHLNSAGPHDYFEKAMENMIKENNIKFFPLSIDDLFCMEIDFQEDLKAVQEHIVPLC